MAQIKLDILRGTLEDNNPLSALRANGLIWSTIFSDVDQYYESHIDRKSKAYHEYNDYRFHTMLSQNYLAEQITFPEPQDININMMPIKLFDLENSLPNNLHQYIPIIKECRWNDGGYRCIPYDEVIKKIAYLTIHESLVQPEFSQRRPGLHIERPNVIKNGGCIISPGHKDYPAMAWGMGYWNQDIACDGIYMASNISNSTKIWPILINNPQEVTDEYGSIEHMRNYIGDGEICKPNKLYWFTDRTPHEALPNLDKAPVYRQFFRLVIGNISIWHSKHNTPNPLGIQPDAPISDADKFL